MRPFGFSFPVLKEKRVIGGGLRDNAMCPVCESVDRERLLLIYLQDRTSLFTKPTKLLHFAPEPQLRATISRHSNVEYVTADLNRPDVTAKVDVANMQFADNSFDAIICNHVLEHIPDDRRAMSELLRVLKPRGWAVLQVPISEVLPATYEDPSILTEKEREQAFGQYDHVRIYAKDYVDRLESVGFVVEQFDWTAHGERYGAPSNRFALIEGERVFAVTKP
jgi:predicted SAM-dependent methyltransferase